MGGPIPTTGGELSFRIVQDLPIDKLQNAVPSAYRPMTDALPDLTQNLTLILFRASKGDVILSRVVDRAVRRIGEPNGHSRIAIGGCFTAEAEDALRRAGFHVLGLSEFHWTDEAYISIRGQPRDIDADT